MKDNWKPYASYPYSKAVYDAQQQQQNHSSQLGSALVGMGMGNIGISGVLSTISGTVSTSISFKPLIPESSKIDYSPLIEKLKKVEPRKIHKRIPDSITPITAYRAWSLTDGLLGSVGYGGTWTPCEIVEARCKSKLHAAPSLSCTCGYWAFPTMDILIDAIKDYDNIAVVGAVALWGKVIDCKNGFRAQYACPTELWLLSEGIEELGLVYNCPVRSLNLDSAKSIR